MLCFGGVGANGSESILDVSDELWSFEPSAGWTKAPASGPAPSPRRCVGWAPHLGKVVLWGGSGIRSSPDGSLRHTFLNDHWLLDPVRGTWEQLFVGQDHRKTPSGDSHPPPRYTPILHSVGGRLVLFGGYTEDRIGKRKLADVWIGDDHGWKEVLPPVRGACGRWPGVRYGCMSAADDSGVIVVGGFCDEGDHIDVWRLDASTLRWEQLAADGGPGMPAPRYCAGLALHDGRLVMFGGRSRRHAKRNFNDLWTFDLRGLRWREVVPCRQPHMYGEDSRFPGYHAKSTSAVIGDRWYIWGGEGLHGHVSDMWCLCLPTLQWELVHGARDDDPRFW